MVAGLVQIADLVECSTTNSINLCNEIFFYTCTLLPIEWRWQEYETTFTPIIKEFQVTWDITSKNKLKMNAFKDSMGI